MKYTLPNTLVLVLCLGSFLTTVLACPSCSPETKPPPPPPSTTCPPPSPAPKPPVVKPPPKPPVVKPPPKPPVVKPPPKPPVVKPPIVYPPPIVFPPPPPPPPSPVPCPPPPPKAAGPETCPIDTLKLGTCLDVLGGLVHIGIGRSARDTCCPVLGGLLDLDAALCLCTTIRAKLLNVQIILPLALEVLVQCGKTPPPGFQCPTTL